MITRLFYTILCFSLLFTSFSQDTLVKHDSSKIAVLFLEVFPTEVHYKKFDNPNGPLYITDKKEVAYILFLNGEKRLFLEKDSIIKKKRTSFLKINIQGAAILNESYINKPYEDYKRTGSLGSPSDETYGWVGKKKIKCGYTFGLNIIVGCNKYINYISGLNYINSKGEYFLDEWQFYPNNSTQISTTIEKHTEYKSTVHFINYTSGIRLIFFKKITLDNYLCLNIPIYSVNKINGYEKTYSKPYYGNFTTTATTQISNTISHKQNIGTNISYLPKISYEFDFNSQKVGLYFAYNMSLKYNLPWYMTGITYYPFKKLR
jgi:hypothetical protein